MGNVTNLGKDSNGDWVPMGAGTDSEGNPVTPVIIKNSGVAVPTDLLNSLNRSRTSVTSTTVAKYNTWTAGENVREIIITTRLGSTLGAPDEAFTLDSQHSLAVCFNAPDQATANDWCSTVDDISDPSYLYIVHHGQPRKFSFSAALRSVWFIRGIGIKPLNVHIEATAGV